VKKTQPKVKPAAQKENAKKAAAAQEEEAKKIVSAKTDEAKAVEKAKTEEAKAIEKAVIDKAKATEDKAKADAKIATAKQVASAKETEAEAMAAAKEGEANDLAKADFDENPASADAETAKAAQVRTQSLVAATAAQAKEFVDATNKYRCMHGAAPVAWDDDMAANANDYISPLTQMTHSSSYDLKPPFGPAGENLAGGTDPLQPAEAVKMWYSEVKDCVALPGCEKAKGNEAVGHFTALVWTGTKKIGCAYSDNKLLVICRYKAGDSLDLETPNMNLDSGNYKTHVLQKVKSEAECAAQAGGAAAPVSAPVSASVSVPAVTSISSGSIDHAEAAVGTGATTLIKIYAENQEGATSIDRWDHSASLPTPVGNLVVEAVRTGEPSSPSSASSSLMCSLWLPAVAMLLYLSSVAA